MLLTPTMIAAWPIALGLLWFAITGVMLWLQGPPVDTLPAPQPKPQPSRLEAFMAVQDRMHEYRRYRRGEVPRPEWVDEMLYG